MIANEFFGYSIKEYTLFDFLEDGKICHKAVNSQQMNVFVNKPRHNGKLHSREFKEERGENYWRKISSFLRWNKADIETHRGIKIKWPKV